MSHLGRARGSRNWGKSESRSRQTAWKISAASPRDNPNLMGMEKIRFLYFSIRADHAAWLPSQHSRTKRSLDQESSGGRFSCFTVVHRLRHRLTVENGGVQQSLGWWAPG